MSETEDDWSESEGPNLTLIQTPGPPHPTAVSGGPTKTQGSGSPKLLHLPRVDATPQPRRPPRKSQGSVAPPQAPPPTTQQQRMVNFGQRESGGQSPQGGGSEIKSILKKPDGPPPPREPLTQKPTQQTFKDYKHKKKKQVRRTNYNH
jgi:hypothetical protein